METQHKSPKFLQITIFKSCLFVGVLMFFSSCWWWGEPGDEFSHQMRVANNTDDTLVLRIVTRHLCPSCGYLQGDSWRLFPKDTQIVSHDYYGGFDLINYYCGSSLDTVIIYKITNDTLNETVPSYNGDPYYVSPLVSWGGPLLYKSDSVHDFYNEASWVFTDNPNTPKRRKKTIITFTITEDDFKGEN